MIQAIKKVNRVYGEIKLPGDKSISHRAVMLSSLAEGKSKVSNLLESADIKSTIECFQKLGGSIEKLGNEYLINGKGYFGLSKPKEKLYAGNSGTTARLISGILAMQKFSSVLTGDQSLSKRPMRRVAEPLRLMGAKINLNQKETLPVEFSYSDNLKAINYELPVASAQVKSAVLLAGIHLDDKSTVIEKIQTRDHTERMLNCEISFYKEQKIISVSQENYPIAKEYVVPSDISSASFFIVLTLLIPGSELMIKDVSLNPTRTGILKVLQNMGGIIEIENVKTIAGEELGDIVVRFSSLKNIEIEKEIIPNIIDEIPILSVAGLFADGEFKINNAEELRHKESDRIKSLCHNYRLLGLEVEEFEDGFSISGDIRNKNVLFESFHDHRIAMAFSILSSIIFDEFQIKDFECVSISNPQFLSQLKSITE